MSKCAPFAIAVTSSSWQRAHDATNTKAATEVTQTNREAWYTVFNDDQGAADATTVTRHLHALGDIVHKHADKQADDARSTTLANAGDSVGNQEGWLANTHPIQQRTHALGSKMLGLRVNAHQNAIEKHEVTAFSVQLHTHTQGPNGGPLGERPETRE